MGKYARKRYRKRRYYRKRGAKVYRMAKTALKRTRKEVKIKDTYAETTVALPSQYYFSYLSAIPQDDSKFGRDGNQVFGKVLCIRAEWKKDPSPASTLCRMIIVQDMQQNGTVPAWLNVIQDNAGSAGSRGLLGPMQYRNDKRFRRLFDRNFVLDVDNPTKVINKVIPIYRDIRWLSEDPVDGAKGQIYLLCASDQAITGVGTPPAMNFYARLYFYDK